MLHHFQKLLQSGIVGFYRSACITTILLHERQNGKTFFKNIYTLITLQESEAKSNMIRRGTLKPLQVDHFRSIMITYQDVDLGTVQQLYESAIERGEWHQPQSSFPLGIEDLAVLPSLFVPIHPVPPIHHGIRNPYRNCNYVFELFAEKKTVSASFTERQRRQVAEWVMETIPIDLMLLSDRWGNIVFQFPITLLTVWERGDQGEHRCMLMWHGTLKWQLTLQISRLIRPHPMISLYLVTGSQVVCQLIMR